MEKTTSHQILLSKKNIQRFKTMKTTCLINNFNYDAYILDAVHSALNQTIPFDEIIIVDDCSTDDSVKLLKQNFSQCPTVKVMVSPYNSGQLSAFNNGFAASSGDVIFFLDADDIYQPEYLEMALRVYQDHPDCGFLFCYADRIGVAAPPQLPIDTSDEVTNLGYSLASAAFLRRWVGEATSMISLRRSVLQQILPVPYLEDWRGGADTCLVYGAALAGAKKFRINKRLVQYRLHGNNITCKGSKVYESINYKFNDELHKRRFFNLMLSKCGYNMVDIAEIIHLEFQSIPKPKLEDLLHYLKIIWMTGLDFHRKLKRSLVIVKHFLAKGSG